MKAIVPSALIGIFLGAAVVYGYLSHQYEAELALARQQAEDLQSSNAKKENELKASQERMKILESANKQLSAKTEVVEVAETPVQPAPQEKQERDRAADMRAFQDRMLKRGLDRWKDTLNLTPDQIQRLTQLFQAEMENAQAGNWNPGALQATMLQVLNPQQKAEFEHAQTRENQARMELRVQTQLSQVQSMFDLTESQKDQIFQKFAQMEQTPSTPTPATATPNQGVNRNQNRQAQAQKRVEALQGILTPAQIQQYQKSQENNGFGFQGR